MEKDLKERGYIVAERLGIPRHALDGAPEHFWPVLLFERIVDAIEHLEDQAYGKE